MSISFETLALAKRYTRSAVAEAMGGTSKIDFRFVTSLPLAGETGVIYCVSKNGSEPDLYDEYYYVNGRFERIPGATIDLTPYATKEWVNGEGYYKKPADGIPETDLDDDTRAAIAKAETALQEHQSLAAYRTAQAQDEIDNTLANIKEIEVGDTEPTDPNVKLWMYQNAGQKIEIPTMEDFRNLKPATDEQVSEAVSDWLEENISGGETIAVDKSLTVEGAAADAKVVGDLKSAVTELNETVSEGLGKDTYTEAIDTDRLEDHIGYINNSNNWNNLTNNNYRYKIVPIDDVTLPITISVPSTSERALRYAFLSSYDTPVDGESANVLLRSAVNIGGTETVNIPNGTTCLYVATYISGNCLFTLSIDHPQEAGELDLLKATVESQEAKITFLVPNLWIPTDNNNGGTAYSDTNPTISYVWGDSTSRAQYIDHVIYFRGTLSLNKNGTITSKINNRNMDTVTVTADTDYRVSGCAYVKTTNFIGFVGDASPESGVRMNYKHIALFDLTAVFGAGNEPPKEYMDALLDNAVVGDWSESNVNIFSGAGVIVYKDAKNIYGTYNSDGLRPYVLATDIGNVAISSTPNANWDGWEEIGIYGQNRSAAVPVYNKVHGTLETDGMLSVLPLWGCWSDNASTTGNPYHGGHVFHGWTTDRLHRLTMLQNIYRDDEAAIFNYIPGDKSDNNEGQFLRLRLGADNIGKGLLLEPIYNDLTEYQYTRAYVFGRLNIQSSPAGQIDHNGAGTGAPFPRNTIPASASDAGVKGDFCFDSNYAYFCVATDTWKRVPLETW